MTSAFRTSWMLSGWRLWLFHALLWALLIWLAFSHPVPDGASRFWSPCDVYLRGTPDGTRFWPFVLALAYVYPLLAVADAVLNRRRVPD